MRELNQRIVLDRLRRGGAATRPSLAKDTGLSKPTVGQALLDLEQDGLVRPAGRTSAGPGRSAVLYEADPAAGHVLGIDIGRGRLRLAVADLSGTWWPKWTNPTAVGRPARWSARCTTWQPAWSARPASHCPMWS